MSAHKHDWQLVHAVYEEYLVMPAATTSDDEGRRLSRGRQMYTCACGETRLERVEGLEPGTEPQVPLPPELKRVQQRAHERRRRPTPPLRSEEP